jgi:hypothetical protein
MMDADIPRIVEAWTRFARSPKANEHNDDFWAVVRLHDFIRNDPESAWQIIETIRTSDPSDHVLANLAAGPVEDLLVHHGERFIDRIETLSRQDPQFRKLLGAVWQSAIPESVWARVKAVAGPSW